jgi:hypothetical protein
MKTDDAVRIWFELQILWARRSVVTTSASMTWG